jgi:hypothetical protein
MRRRPGRLAQTIIGILVGMFFAGHASAIPVEVTADASWTSTKQVIESTKQTIAQGKLIASSEASRLEQLAEHARNAQRWLDTVNHYSREIIEDVRRFTSLKGILGVMEERLGLDDDTLKAMADVGEVVRAAFSLKQQFDTLLHTRLHMIESMYKRAKAGIFDPAQDLADLDDYLRDGIGRSSERVIQSRERLARLDNELETWIYDFQQLRKEEAAKEAELAGVVQQLKAEGSLSSNVAQHQIADSGDRSKPRLLRRENQSAEAIAALWTNKNLLEGQIADLNKRIAELREKIEARYKLYHIKFDADKAQAGSIRRAIIGWEGMSEAKEKAILILIDPYQAREQGAGGGDK